MNKELESAIKKLRNKDLKGSSNLVSILNEDESEAILNALNNPFECENTALLSALQQPKEWVEVKSIDEVPDKMVAMRLIDSEGATRTYFGEKDDFEGMVGYFRIWYCDCLPNDFPMPLPNQLITSSSNASRRRNE